MFQYNFMQNAFMIAILISVLCPLIGMFFHPTFYRIY